MLNKWWIEHNKCPKCGKEFESLGLIILLKRCEHCSEDLGINDFKKNKSKSDNTDKIVY